MPNRESRYYFGRLNIVSAYNEDKKDFLERGLNSGILKYERNYSWGFFETEDVPEQGEYISGFLVKYRPFDPEQFVNTETREIEDQEIRNRVKSKSRFFLHVKTGIIAYQVVNGISDSSFRRNFAKLLAGVYHDFFIDAEIQAINQEESFFEAVQRFESIAKVSIYLHPSNPSSRHVWKNTDERLKDLEVESYTEIYKLKESRSNLDIREDQEINSKLYMASDGYGKAKIKGKRNGEYETITTGDNPIEAEVENLVENTEPPQTILRQILPTFRSLFNRIQS